MTEIHPDFSGPVALFPLPNVVFFPGTYIPLHIFEPRYRQMVADAMAGDRLIVMTLLAPGWEAAYEGAPDVHPIGTLGRIARHERLADGRSNILLEGVARVRIQDELDGAPYRRATVGVLQDHLTLETLPQASRLALQIHEQHLDLYLAAPGVLGVSPPIPGEAMSPARFFDKLTDTMKIDPVLKQAILGELDVLRRGQRLSGILEQILEIARKQREVDVEPDGDSELN